MLIILKREIQYSCLLILAEDWQKPMKTSDLAVRPLISPKEAEKMIWAFIYHGNHSRHEVMRGQPKHRIEKWFSDNEEPVPKLVTRCRSFFDTSVPFVENFISSTFTLVADAEGNAKASIRRGNGPVIEFDAPGTIGLDYESKFESACKARDNAIHGASLEEFHTAIIKGIASIESFIGLKAEDWNHSLAAYTKINDSKGAKVTFEDKVKLWIPIMTGGTKLDCGGAMWADFLFLQAIRDHDAIHAKSFAQGVSFSTLASAINKFKTGIADFLLQLHLLFSEAVPRTIIRARFFPEIYVKKRPKNNGDGIDVT